MSLGAPTASPFALPMDRLTASMRSAMVENVFLKSPITVPLICRSPMKNQPFPGIPERMYRPTTELVALLYWAYADRPRLGRHGLATAATARAFACVSPQERLVTCGPRDRSTWRHGG